MTMSLGRLKGIIERRKKKRKQKETNMINKARSKHPSIKEKNQ